jgi:phenylalanyl-tRNA synthetase alpha subunit
VRLGFCFSALGLLTLTFDWHNGGGDSFFCFPAPLANNAEALTRSVNYLAVPVNSQGQKSKCRSTNTQSPQKSCASQQSTSKVKVLKNKSQELSPQLCQSTVKVKSQSAEKQKPRVSTPAVPVNSQRQKSPHPVNNFLSHLPQNYLPLRKNPPSAQHP